MDAAAVEYLASLAPECARMLRELIDLALNDPLYKWFKTDQPLVRYTRGVGLTIYRLPILVVFNSSPHYTSFKSILQQRIRYYYDFDPDIAQEIYERFGIEVYGDMRRFALLPHIRDTVTTHNRHDISELLTKLAREYLTPYVDEIVALTVIDECLPQPIARAVEKCMRGVMMRRLKTDALIFVKIDVWSSQRAWLAEVIYTMIDTYDCPRYTTTPKTYEWFEILRAYPAGMSWEDAARRLQKDRLAE